MLQDQCEGASMSTLLSLLAAAAEAGRRENKWRHLFCPRSHFTKLTFKKSLIRSCKKGFFGCGNNRCVLESAVCNKVDDCGDFSDEEGCPCPDKTMFKCAKGPCISAKRKCDAKPDCEDASDEMDCPKTDCNLFQDQSLSQIGNAPLLL